MSDTAVKFKQQHITQKNARNYKKNYNELHNEIYVLKSQNNELKKQNKLLYVEIKKLKVPFYRKILNYIKWKCKK